MINEELIQKIRAEIERRYNGEAPKHDQQCNFDDGYFVGIDAIAQFLDSLESEKPINQDELKNEIDRFLSNATKMDKGEWKGKYPISELGFRTVARHFAKWGAEHRGSSEIPNELEEAAMNYIAPIENEDGLKVINFSGQDIKDAFIAGVEWKDRSINWIRDLVKAAIKKPEEAQGILERIDRMLNKEDEK